MTVTPRPDACPCSNCHTFRPFDYPPDLGTREIPQPPRPQPWTPDYEAGYDTGYRSGMETARRMVLDGQALRPTYTLDTHDGLDYTTLEADLDDLARTNPEVARTAAAVDEIVARIGRQHEPCPGCNDAGGFPNGGPDGWQVCHWCHGQPARGQRPPLIVGHMDRPAPVPSGSHSSPPLPCRDTITGRLLTDHCHDTDCGHVILAHRRDGTCRACYPQGVHT